MPPPLAPSGAAASPRGWPPDPPRAAFGAGGLDEGKAKKDNEKDKENESEALAELVLEGAGGRGACVFVSALAAAVRVLRATAGAGSAGGACPSAGARAADLVDCAFDALRTSLAPQFLACGRGFGGCALRAGTAAEPRARATLLVLAELVAAPPRFPRSPHATGGGGPALAAVSTLATSPRAARPLAAVGAWRQVLSRSSRRRLRKDASTEQPTDCLAHSPTRTPTERPKASPLHSSTKAKTELPTGYPAPSPTKAAARKKAACVAPACAAVVQCRFDIESNVAKRVCKIAKRAGMQAKREA